MQKKKKQVKHYEPLKDVPMSVSKDGTKVLIGGQAFVRTVLPSVAVPKAAPIEEALLDELESE